ncbi:MAG: hypothetical protein [Inoviridae sp.]|nr:MAG: hypothetical protein [Inoviridae sp.]
MKKIILSILILSLFPFVTFADVAYIGQASSLSSTYTFNASSTSDYLFVHVVNSTSDDCAVTYAGNELTKIGTGGYLAGSDAYLTLFYLQVPVTGDNDVVISCTDFASSYAVEFSGVTDHYDYTSFTGTDVINSTFFPLQAGDAMITFGSGRYGPHYLTPDVGIDNDFTDVSMNSSFGMSLATSTESSIYVGWSNYDAGVDTTGIIVGLYTGIPPGPTSTVASTTAQDVQVGVMVVFLQLISFALGLILTVWIFKLYII